MRMISYSHLPAEETIIGMTIPFVLKDQTCSVVCDKRRADNEISLLLFTSDPNHQSGSGSLVMFLPRYKLVDGREFPTGKTPTYSDTVVRRALGTCDRWQHLNEHAAACHPVPIRRVCDLPATGSCVRACTK
jgi:hypothetical protein